MALINKIREKSGVAVGVIAVSLILFIVGGDLLGPGSLFGGQDQTVGEIAGQKISYPEFNAKVDEARAAYEQQTGRPATEQDQVQLRDQAWNQFILDIAYQKEYDALGLSVTPDELVDMVQGNYISPAIRQTFTDPKTGSFDKNTVINYLKNLKTLPAEQQQAWANFEKNLSADRTRTKYENLLRLSSFVTTAEAQKEYQAQNTRANAKFLLVPYYSVPDTTVKITDGQLQEYLDKHKDEYKSINSRTIQYVTFPVAPSKEDSTALYDQIKTLARGLATATNDSSYARMNSDIQAPLYMTLGEMPEQLKATVGTFAPGGVYGPYKEGNTYFIYKYGGVKKDTNFTVRASHILIRAAGSDSAKAAARITAEGILRQIQGGASFEALAQTNSADGSAQQGGDLGYFKNNNQMVKPFQDAIFGFNGTGLIPRLVETEFGYHIIKVTEPKTNTLYRISTIGKTITPSQATRDEVYRKAEQFATESQTKEAFDENAKKDKTLVVATAERIPENSTSVNALGNARELVRWAFNDDTDLNDVSSAVEVDDQYVVAVLTGETSEDEVKIDNFRPELTAKVRNQVKAEQIIAKLNSASGTLESIAQKYGAGALVEEVPDLNLANGFLKSAGVDPVAVGKIFGLKNGKRSKPFAGDAGVLIVETNSVTPAPTVADYTVYKTQLQQNASSRTGFMINEAIRESAKVKDRRAKFY
ncbi:peptidylprolyl isomerase [Larkinella humicola]|uniref:Periplasmic chaperone PpiD n=1 Tax=Larkinella humicola TaxID=2607654 RepID=A0A5N1JHM0_9BACT|nr:peptidylprolyl isomerase [Larkinella humicola]KAA9355214.1 peptidylprolyl isomerase [Larkinella humicola]